MSDLKQKNTLRNAGVIAGATTAAIAPLALTPALEHIPVIALIYSVAVLASAPMAWSKKLSLQMLSRSVWWGTGLYSIWILGLAAYFGDAPSELLLTFGTVLGGSVAALVSAGKTGLAQSSSLFAPRAARTTLMLSIILALADTQALGFYGLLAGQEGSLSEAAVFFASAGAMIVSLFGLYRLKVWGLAATIIANLAIAGLALGGGLSLPIELAAALAITAGVQLLLPIPLIRQMLGKGKASTASIAADHTPNSAPARASIGASRSAASSGVVFDELEKELAAQAVTATTRA